MNELSNRYLPQEIEDRIYKKWLDDGHFKAQEKSDKPPFSIILPPPNITGFLHIGHALDQSIQDCLIRWKRMSGYNTLWMPGTDHAGIATQAVVEKALAKEGLSKNDLGREKFLEHVWEWKEKYGKTIINQMQKLGASCDWDRHTFTLDSGVSDAVKKVFVSLYQKKWIYRGTKLINWSPKLQSAISNLEVDHKEVKGHIYHIKYPVENENLNITIATTRPETLLGDTAVAVHPEDDRYKHLVGKDILLPLTKRKIKIIADSYVDPSFGSGAVKITPAHDFNDYEVGIRNSLEMINILNPDGTLNRNAGDYQNLSVVQARKKILEDLEKQGLIEKIESHKHSVGHCSRSNCVIEPFLSSQWFVKTSELSLPAKKAVETEETKIEPNMWAKTYLHWMNIIEDWCISRQLWWGHRIPAWHCQSCKHITVCEKTPQECESCKSKNIKQDKDVLDTWFSSQLWPFSTMGWPQETQLKKTFYPTNVLVTGHDIIFFWVTRMMMAALEVTKEVPFKTIYIHGLIRDSKGVKMSKSLGNSIDPLELIKTHGADALRMSLMSQLSVGRDIKFSMQNLESYRNLMNKIWNAARFSLSVLPDSSDFQDTGVLNKKYLSNADHWITEKLFICEQNVDQALSQYRFNDAVKALYHFIWHEFCDWYLELIKPIVYKQTSDQDQQTESSDEEVSSSNNKINKQATQMVLAQTLNRIVKLIHPFAPFISEEIYQKLPIKDKSLIIDKYPTIDNDKKWLNIRSTKIALEMDVVKEVISSIRTIRGENKIKPGEKIIVYLFSESKINNDILQKNKDSIVSLSRLKVCKIENIKSMNKCAVTEIQLKNTNILVIIPLEGLVDFDKEVERLQKFIEKINKELSSVVSRFANKNFIKNAPKEVVQVGQEQIKSLKNKINTAQESLKRFQ